MESNIIIECGNIKLEGALQKNTSQNAVIISHPHPLYGGDMNNPVVMTIAASFFEKGVTTLRFNCEQEDIRAAMSWLKEKGYQKIYLAGYSFGARVNARVVSKGCDIEDHIMVSPPMEFISFDDIEKMPSTGLIVTGANDDIAPSDLIQKHINRWKIIPRYEIIENCDHFYSDCLDRLKRILIDYLS